MIGNELCAGKVTFCRKCKIHFQSTPNPKSNKPYLWCKDCRATLYNTRGKKTKLSNNSEVASSISADVDDDTSNSDVGDVDDVSDVCASDNPNSITCELKPILST